MSASLLVQSTGIWAHNHSLEKLDVCRLGRHPENNVRLSDQSVSGHHAEIRHDGERWLLRDLDSGNGTFLNDMRIQSEAALRNGDIIRIGGAEIVFKDQETAITEDIWGKTSLNFMKMRFSPDEMPKAVDEGPLQLPGVYDPNYKAADAAPNHVGRVPDYGGAHDVAAETPTGQMPTQSGGGAAPAQDAGATWAMQTLAKILGEMAVQRNKSQSELVAHAMFKLRDAAIASYGFLVFVNPETRRWAVQVCFDGNGLLKVDALTDFASSVTREAISQGKVLTENEHPVSGQPFLAIPVLKEGKVHGAVYLERKPGNPSYAPAQVQLATDLGGYLVELHTQIEKADEGPPSSFAYSVMPGEEESARGDKSKGGQTDFSQFYQEPPPQVDVRPVLSAEDNALPSREELFGDEDQARRSRLKRFEYAVLIPVDQRPNLPALAQVYSALHNIDPAEAQHLVIDTKGLLADQLSFDRLAELQPRLESHGDAIRIVQIAPDMRPGDVNIPPTASLGRLELTAGSLSLPWSSIRLMSCGRIDRKPVIDLYAPEDRIHIRLASTALDFTELAGTGQGDPNHAAHEIMRRIKESASQLVVSQTVRALLSRKTPRPQKFSGLREYNRYNLWLLLSHFADKVGIDAFK